MTRDEFLNRLGELLACLPADQVRETQEFYAEAIADRMEDGMTEAEAVAAMGTLGEVAEATLDELARRAARNCEDQAQEHGASMGARHRGLSGMDSAAARVRRRCRYSLHLHLGSCALRVDRGRGIRGRGRGGAPVHRGRHHYRACSVRFNLDGNGIRFHRCGAPRGSRCLDGVQADRVPLCPLGEESRFALLERSRQ